MYVAELKKRKYRGKRPVEISNPQQAFQVLRERIEDWSREHFLVVLLDARHGVRGIETVSVGSLTASIVHPREVFKEAISASAASVIFAHNHPSGDTEASEDDIALTKRLAEAGEIVGINVLDHLIIGGKSFTSFKRLGLF